MHLILLGLGLLIGAYALYRFFMKANASQVKALFLVVASVAVAIAMFVLAVTGRLPAAFAVLGAVAPIAIGIWRQKQVAPKAAATSEISSRDEALEILGLKDGASEAEIKAAYKKLMAKVHPDAEGSEWMAAKLNAARDLLLDKKNENP